MNKIPEIGLLFWVIKICATTLGETAGDLLSQTMDVGYATSTIILLSLFALALMIQLLRKTFNPWIYWLVILSTSTAGTTLSDFMDRSLGFGYAKGALILLSVLIVVLFCWRYTQGTISVQSIRSRGAEVFYWLAILVSNTLGTAFGDFLADNSGLGFAGGALLVAGVLGLVILTYFYTGVSRVLLFWLAFILTRPLGATAGDFLTKNNEQGGLNFGTSNSSLILAAVMVLGIVLAKQQHSKEIKES